MSGNPATLSFTDRSTPRATGSDFSQWSCQWLSSELNDFDIYYGDYREWRNGKLRQLTSNLPSSDTFLTHANISHNTHAQPSYHDNNSSGNTHTIPIFNGGEKVRNVSVNFFAFIQSVNKLQIHRLVLVALSLVQVNRLEHNISTFLELPHFSVSYTWVDNS